MPNPTTPDSLTVTQADREAAASGYFAWCSGNPVIPDRMRAGNADDHSMVQAFARHRQTTRTDAEPVAWQHIETAPKMREILLWADTSTADFRNWKMASGYYHDRMNVWIWAGEQVRNWEFPPTHWMPLPAAPGETVAHPPADAVAELVEGVAELQLAAFLAGRGSVVTKADGRTLHSKTGPTMDDYRNMARALIAKHGGAKP